MDRWHEVFLDKLKLIDFRPSKSYPYLYMKYSIDHYVYITIYSYDFLK